MRRVVTTLAVAWLLVLRLRRPEHTLPATRDLKEPKARSRWHRSRWVPELLVALFAGLLAVGVAAWLDQQRADREAAQSERLGWRVTLATGDAFQDSDLSDVNLSGIAITRKDLSRVSLRTATLRSTVLRETDLAAADLSGADMTSSVFTDVTLAGADLRRANLSNAMFQGADLSGVDLRSANSFTSATFSEVCYDYGTRWPAAPPPLDWRSCWSGYSDEGSPDQGRSRPDPECDVGDLQTFLPNYLNGFPAPDDRELCGYLGYLEGHGVGGSDSDKVFTGTYSCGQVGAVNTDVLVRISDPAKTEPDDLVAGRTTLFAAAKFLCPEQSTAILPALLPGSSAGL